MVTPRAFAPLLLAAACTSSFNPDNDAHVVGSQTWPTGISLPGKGAVTVMQRHGQVGEHTKGIHRAQRLEALKANDLRAAARAIAAMDVALEGFFVPQGHADSQRLAQTRGYCDVYRFDWELRRPDHTIATLVAHADAYRFQGGGIYKRFCTEAARLMAQCEELDRPTYDTLYRNSYGFDAVGKQWLDYHYQRLDQREARVRYNAYIAAGRIDDANAIAYKLGLEGFVDHLQTHAKGRMSERELEGLLRSSAQMASTPELRAKLEQAHADQWRDMIAADAREQRERFRKLDEEAARARAAADLAERDRLHAMKMESLRQGFVWQ